MAVSTCTVSGTLKDITNTAISGAGIEAALMNPLLYGDGTLLASQKVTTTTAADGTWSLVLAENASTTSSTRITFLIPDGSGGIIRKDYYVIVPNTPTATLASLITGQ